MIQRILANIFLAFNLIFYVNLMVYTYKTESHHAKVDKTQKCVSITNRYFWIERDYKICPEGETKWEHFQKRN